MWIAVGFPTVPILNSGAPASDTATAAKVTIAAIMRMQSCVAFFILHFLYLQFPRLDPRPGTPCPERKYFTISKADTWRTVKTARDDPVADTTETPEGTILYDPPIGRRTA
jgi:hypothetical protein